ncbi:flavin reductase family protein [uncultured Tateyamaria sp.]|uniref:flavin reductase family protein n=1 Tax=uncultured Tateyamaria sp. TaxID=455651 RepID=UPI002635E7A6|nr:flavin reductase family protein [uncultured Tateyamaria sp.]
MNPLALRDAFGRFMTGVTVITARDASGAPVGFTANSFTSVSLDPPLLLVCPGRFLSAFAAFEACTHFAVNVLAEGQEDVSNTFAGYKGDRFAKVPHHFGAHKLPLINGAVAQFCCKTHQVVPAGDHVVLMGEITDVSHTDAAGLGYVGGRYFSLGLERETGAGAATVLGAIVEVDGHVLMEQAETGMRPVQVAGTPTGAQRDHITAALKTSGLRVQINQVYSAFSDDEAGVRHTYYLAHAPHMDAAPAGMCLVPFSALPAQAFSTPAIGHMMTRFAREAQSRNFSLYLGDAEGGEIHALS